MSEGTACLMRSARTPSPLCIPQPRAGRARLLLNRSSSLVAVRGFFYELLQVKEGASRAQLQARLRVRGVRSDPRSSFQHAHFFRKPLP